jgi:hypothetical protein
MATLILLNSAITLFAAVMIICMLQSAFTGSGWAFRLALAILAGGLLAGALRPLWGIWDIGLSEMPVNLGIAAVVFLLRARQKCWKLPAVWRVRRRRREIEELQ